MRARTTFALVGSGFRAQALLKVAHELPTVHCVGAVVRTPRGLPVPTFPSLDACLRAVGVDFVLTATPKPVTPAQVVEAVERGLPALAETPPASDLDGLRTLWSAVGDSGLVAVAEQYPLMPTHAARAALVATGSIGRPTQVQVSLDDTRAFASIPARHDLSRRVDAGYLARLVLEHRLSLDEAVETAVDLAYRLPLESYARA